MDATFHEDLSYFEASMPPSLQGERRNEEKEEKIQVCANPTGRNPEATGHIPETTGRTDPSERSPYSSDDENRFCEKTTGRNPEATGRPDSSDENRFCEKMTGRNPEATGRADSNTTGRRIEATGRTDSSDEIAFCPNATGRTEPSDRSPSTSELEDLDSDEGTGKLSFLFGEDPGGDNSNGCCDQQQNTTPSSQPSDQSSRDEETLEVIPEAPNTIPYTLPPRTTRGKPKPQYCPDLTAKSKYPINNHVSTHRLSKSYASFVNQLSTVCVPNKWQDAITDSRWVEAMAIEMEALEKNSTWEMVQLPQGKKPVGCRWIYTIKYKADGSIDRYKARLVAKGYTQTYGIDHQETFAPVAKINTIRVLMSLAANLDWPLLQYDVKNAFLHGELQEEVYMEPPPGTSMALGPNTVCKLRKSLYGLKQSPRAWFGKFTDSMKRFGYTQSHSDHTLFLKRRGDKLTALIIYVDDMVVTGNDNEEMKNLQKLLASKFEMKELGELQYFLGIEVARSTHGIFLSQRKYVLDLLTETGMLDCKPADTPIEQNHKLGMYPNQVPTDKERYQRLVGRLIYLSHTRPDIAYAVSMVSQFMHQPSEAHMNAVTRIMRYLKAAPAKGLIFSKHTHMDPEGYTDADWAGSITDRRSTSGYFTFVGGNLVTWRSKKQKVVARSSAEAEFRGMAQGVCELLWLRRLLKDLGVKPLKATNLYCDNKSAIEIAHNPVQHDRTKHVEVDRHFIKEKLERGIIKFPFVNSENQLADILTKAVSSKVFHDSLDKLGMRDIFAPT
ncbi:hypothetical protein CerSpe_069960 [Prunus speciosa]